MTRSLSMLAGLVLLVVAIRPAESQRSRASIASALARDTAALQVVLAGIRSQLGGARGSAARSATPPAWELGVPRGAPALWATLPDSLRSWLRARLRTPADTAFQRAILERVRLEDGTLVALFVLGAQWRCADGWMGGATRYELRSARTRAGWAPATVNPTMFADPGPCARPARRPRRTGAPRR